MKPMAQLSIPTLKVVEVNYEKPIPPQYDVLFNGLAVKGYLSIFYITLQLTRGLVIVAIMAIFCNFPLFQTIIFVIINLAFLYMLIKFRSLKNKYRFAYNMGNEVFLLIGYILMLGLAIADNNNLSFDTRNQLGFGMLIINSIMFLWNVIYIGIEALISLKTVTWAIRDLIEVKIAEVLAPPTTTAQATTQQQPDMTVANEQQATQEVYEEPIRIIEPLEEAWEKHSSVSSDRSGVSAQPHSISIALASPKGATSIMLSTMNSKRGGDNSNDNRQVRIQAAREHFGDEDVDIPLSDSYRNGKNANNDNGSLNMSNSSGYDNVLRNNLDFIGISAGNAVSVVRNNRI
jgi:hypothetical protein